MKPDYVPAGYITGVFRGDNGENMVTHLYKGTFGDPGLPMCKRGWQYGSDGYSIFRNNVSKKGICLICLRRALKGLDGIPCPEVPSEPNIGNVVASFAAETLECVSIPEEPTEPAPAPGRAS